MERDIMFKKKERKCIQKYDELWKILTPNYVDRF